jgi:hypothetical protein
MKIDLRTVRTLWLNLKEHERNAQEMQQMLDSAGFVNHARSPGIRVSGHERVDYDQKVDHFMGVGLAQLQAMREIRDNLPALILEDDVKIRNLDPILEIPDDTDAVYLGYSVLAGNSPCVDLENGYVKIEDVLTSHAILYITPAYLKAAMTVVRFYLLEKCAPLDLGLARIQWKYQVLAPYAPKFIQSDDRDSQNKWEKLTSRPLRSS